MHEKLLGVRRIDKQRRKVLRATKSSLLTQSPALRVGRRELSDCIPKSHPCNFKYFMDTEVYHEEQLLLLWQGL